jgi:hypothetical protein
LPPEQLRENYEQLRAYALSPVKNPMRPVGLDLWLKRGFLAWITAMLVSVPAAQPMSARAAGTEIVAGISMLLANILMGWNDAYDGAKRENQPKSLDAQGIPVRQAVHAAAGTRKRREHKTPIRVKRAAHGHGLG